MKKYFKTLVMATMGLFALAACEDVPAPYDIPGSGEDPVTDEIYSSNNLSTGWNTYCIGNYNPWSQGSSYTQATGYQAWDGGAKSNKEVTGWLVSPSIKTVVPSGKAKFSFDNTIRYTNNVSTWKKNHKIYISKDYTGGTPEVNGTWEEIAWNAEASPYSDWTLYTSGEIQIPEEFVNEENVHIAFWFYAPASVSTTWELMNFVVKEGEAGVNPEPDPDAIEVTCAEAAEICNALEDGATSAETYAVTGYITDVFDKISNNQQSFWMADEKDGGKVLQAYWANLPAGVTGFVKDSKVKIFGQLMKYVKDGNVTVEIKNADVIILESPDAPPTPEGTLTIAEAIAAQGTSGATVKGYIVAALKAGVSNSSGAIEDIEFSDFTGYNAIFLADSPDEKNPANMLCAKLNDTESPADLKAKANLKDNPGNLGKMLTVTGNLKACYTGLNGIRGITAYELEGGDDPTPGEITHISIAEFLAKEDPNTTYELTGTVQNIKNTTYGNFDLVEDGASIYIYGLLDFQGNTKNFASLGITEGTKITITGKYKDYNGTAEIANAQIVRIEEGGDTPGGGGGDEGDANAYTIDLPYTLGTNAYDDGTATINGVAVDKTIKIGTSTKAGSFTLDVPAGKLSFYAITWNDLSTADVKVGGETVTVKGNAGAAGNKPYTITVTDGDKYEVNVPSATTLEVTSDKRIIFFGIKSSK